MDSFLVLLLLLASLSAPAAAEDLELSIEHQGRTRYFYLHLPPYKRAQMPLVMAFHGGGGNASLTAEKTGFSDLADRDGFAVVYPEGTGRKNHKLLTWNAGECCAYAKEHQVDDVGFISKMIDYLVLHYGIDRRRVYATGHSNGAQISYRLACELSEKIAAIGPNAAQGVLERCHPTRAVPVLHIHGTADKSTMYYGGVCGGQFQNYLRELLRLPAKEVGKFPCAPVPDYVRGWAVKNQCSLEPETIFQKNKTTCERYSSCEKNAEVILCTIEEGGHTWAGGEYEAPVCKRRPKGKACKRWKERVGPISSDIDASEMFVDFFKRHRL